MDLLPCEITIPESAIDEAKLSPCLEMKLKKNVYFAFGMSSVTPCAFNTRDCNLVFGEIIKLDVKRQRMQSKGP